METLRYLVKMVTNNTIYLEEKDGNLRDIWNGKMVVMGAGETLWVRVGSCVLSRRSICGCVIERSCRTEVTFL